MPFVSFGNEKNAPHLNVDHFVGLELIESPGKLPAVRIRATRAECDLRIEFATKVEAQDLIDAIINYSLQSAATAFELVATTGAKPLRLPCNPLRKAARPWPCLRGLRTTGCCRASTALARCKP